MARRLASLLLLAALALGGAAVPAAARKPVAAAAVAGRAAHVHMTAAAAPAVAATPEAPAPVSSASPAAPPPEPIPHLSGSQDINWGRQITITLIWLVVICGAAWFILKAFYARGGVAGMTLGMGRRRLIQVLDRHVLSPQKAIMVIEVAGHVLVVGMAEQGINLLTELDPEDVRPEVQPAPSAMAPPSRVEAPFPEQLTGLFGKRTPPE